MVMAGGGFRFGIYLGMHAAARAAGRAPDLLLATCGGAIAAAVIGALPDDAQRKQWIGSPQMYRFWCGLRSAERGGILGAARQALMRRLSSANAPTIPDLFDDYLFDMPLQLPLPPGYTRTPDVAVAIIGGKLLFSGADVGQARGARKLFAETVFCQPRTAQLLRGATSALHHPRWGQHAIAEQVLTDVTMPLETAARISVCDMYYLACHAAGAHHYMGGAVNLFPIEMARQLADVVMMEFKQGFDQVFAIPAWRSVLGLDGNARLRYANGQFADIRVDTSDITRALARQTIHQKLEWRRNRVALRLPEDYATFVQYMDDQWQYGYQRCIEACERADAGQLAVMRQVDRYNAGSR